MGGGGRSQAIFALHALVFSLPIRTPATQATRVRAFILLEAFAELAYFYSTLRLKHLNEQTSLIPGCLDNNVVLFTCCFAILRIYIAIVQIHKVIGLLKRSNYLETSLLYTQLINESTSLISAGGFPKLQTKITLRAKAQREKGVKIKRL